MRYKTIEIEELFTDKNRTKEIVNLMENNGAQLKIIYLKKHEELEEDISHSDTCIFVSDGEIELIFSNNDSCSFESCNCTSNYENEENKKHYKIKKEQIFFFEKNVHYSIKALKDTTFLLIKI